MLTSCLIPNIDQSQDEHVDDAWADIAIKRFKDMESGVVTVISWEQIKKDVLSMHKAGLNQPFG